MNWGPRPFPLLFSLFFFFFYSFPSFSVFSFKNRTLKIHLGWCWRARSAPPAVSEAERQPKSNVVHHIFKIWYPVAIITIIFSKINWQNWHISCTLNVCLGLAWVTGGGEEEAGSPVPPPPLGYAVAYSVGMRWRVLGRLRSLYRSVWEGLIAR